MKEWMEKAKKKIRGLGVKEWGTLLLIGICFLIIVIPAEGKEVKTPSEESENKGETLLDETNAKNVYVETMERRVEELLSQVEKVGKVKVMITVGSTEEKKVLKDGTSERKETTETDSTGGNRNVMEESSDYETVFEGEEPYLISESYPEVIGVVVIAEGSGTGSVDYDILNAVQVLFDLPAHKIKIMKMK